MTEDRTSIECFGDDSMKEGLDELTGPFKELAAGSYHGCALQEQGRVVCFGERTRNQCVSAPEGVCP